jgi:hypothetical protein
VYIPIGQPMCPSLYLPDGQGVVIGVQSDSTEVPLVVVTWPDGHSRQEREPGVDWYLEIGQEAHSKPEVL